MKFVPMLLWLAAANLSALEIHEDDRVIEVLGEEKKLILRYHKAESQLPDGVAKEYRRSGYIHPVMTKDGREVSGDFAADHLHQHGVFFAWTSGSYNGKAIDFWNQKKNEGRVAHRRVISKDAGDGKVSFSVELSHFDQTGGGGEILREVWNVTVWGGEGETYWFDLESRQRLVAEKPLLIKKHHYGGMAWRGNYAWLGKDGCQFLTSEGKGRVDANHTRPLWLAMSGKLADKPATVIGMGHPKNFRAKQPVRVHPDKPYFCFAPMVEGAFSIEKDKEYVSRYRFVISSGKLEKPEIDALWRGYRDDSLDAD